MPFSPKYRSKIHEALLVQVVSDVGTETGYELLDDRQLEEIVSSKDLAIVKQKNYH